VTLPVTADNLNALTNKFKQQFIAINYRALHFESEDAEQSTG
jgi:hypothetical protein